MAQTTYEEVARLAEQLPIEDQQALMTHLQALAEERELTFREWKLLYDSLKSEEPLLQDFSDNREYWYGDDGR
jgi:hypothetical protein